MTPGFSLAPTPRPAISPATNANPRNVQKKRHSADHIVGKLRQSVVVLGQGKTVEEAWRGLEITVQTYYRSAEAIRWDATGYGQATPAGECPAEEVGSGGCRP